MGCIRGARQRWLLLVCALFLPFLAVQVQGHGVASPWRMVDTVSGRDSLAVSDSLQAENDGSLVGQGDTVQVMRLPMQHSKLDAPIFAQAEDSIRYAVSGKRVQLYGKASVKYKQQEFQADFIDFDLDKSVLYAEGLKDSTGKVLTRPVYKDGSEEYTMEAITYNFNTQQARITGVMTQVTEGYLHGKVIKKLPNDEVNVKDGKFTTCDALEPHFYIRLTKAKVIPHDKIVTGPAILYIADVPTPIVLPFGFFPNTSKRSSGLILPEYGEEQQRGFFVRNGGLYFGLSDYVDLALLGGYYSKGSWDASARLNYNWRYHFQGMLSFSYSSLNFGHEGTKEYSESSSYMINWTFVQDRRRHPNSSFQANVSFGSSNHNRYNARNTQDYLNNQITSSISYQRQFPGTPFSLAMSLNHSMNSRDSTVSLRLPQLSVNMTTIYPFRRKHKRGGEPSWYEKIGFSYSTELQNNLYIKEKDLFTHKALDKMQNGMRHQLSTSTSFTLLNYVNLSPSISYGEQWYLQSIRYHWDTVSRQALRDTVKGFARAWNFNTSLSASTKVYGMYSFSSKAKVQAIRHVMTPSVSVGYHPDFSEPLFNMYREVQISPDGKTRRYSLVEGMIYGGAPQGKSGTLNFSLGNNIEMKLRANQKDTAAKAKKVPILESLSFSMSYNFLADSMELSPLSISARTNILGFLQVSANARFNPYALTEKDMVYNRFQFDVNRELLRFENVYVSCSFSLSKVLTGKDSHAKPPQPLAYLPGFMPFNGSQVRDFLVVDYGDFEAPWSLNCSYNLSYTKTGSRESLMQSMSIYGNITLAKDWRIGFSTGYDFTRQQVNMTSFSVAKDLHCWDMSASIVPFGAMQSYNFRIGVKAAMLHDLKYEKSKSYLDNLRY